MMNGVSSVGNLNNRNNVTFGARAIITANNQEEIAAFLSRFYKASKEGGFQAQHYHLLNTPGQSGRKCVIGTGHDALDLFWRSDRTPFEPEELAGVRNFSLSKVPEGTIITKGLDLSA